MINPHDFALFLSSHIGLFAGVPDSLLKPLNSALSEIANDNFYTTANEGQAVAFACAYHLATKKLGLVYMQNSGLGNAINPLLSLADELVYKIPLVMIIGLRGGENDEPQHKKQGLVTKEILNACDIDYFILSNDFNEAKKQCLSAFEKCLKDLSIIAILVEKNTFTPFEKTSLQKSFGENKTLLAPENKQMLTQNLENSSLKRERAIELILARFKGAKFVCSTGHIGRECYDLREKNKQKHSDDFLVVGSMGFASSIAFMLSKFTQKRLVCLDGDGAFLMHLGAISNFKGANFTHIVLNNFAHDSVGGQETNAKNVDFTTLAKACGYDIVTRASDEFTLQKTLDELKNKQALIFIEIIVKKGARKDLGRPSNLLALKDEFCKDFL